MASLNLDALKKKVSETPENIVQDATLTATIDVATPVGVPKISLMKLKEFTSPIQEEITHMPIQINEVADETGSVVEEMETISLETPIIETPDSLVIEDTEVIEQSSSESIFSSETLEEQESEVAISQEPELKIEEVKEFFPSLNLMEDFNISDDLLGIEDISIKTEKTTITPIIETPIIETTHIEKAVQEPVMVIEKQVPVISEMEHVQEVKNELSEQRKGGFRFFANKKASMLAGIGIVTTFSLIGLFGAGFFSSAVPVGKSNIQEAVQIPTPEEATQPIPVPETTEVAPETVATTQETVQATPEVIDPTPTATVYEAGRDYTVIKNTKKNLKKQ